MKEKYELIGYGNSAHLIRKYKRHWWSKWQIEMDGATPKIYPIYQEHYVHDHGFFRSLRTISFPTAIPLHLLIKQNVDTRK